MLIATKAKLPDAFSPKENDRLPKTPVGTLIFSYRHRLGSFFFWFNILNFNIFGFFFFKKKKYFGGYEEFVDTFWRSSQNWTIFRGHFYAL